MLFQLNNFQSVTIKLKVEKSAQVVFPTDAFPSQNQPPEKMDSALRMSAVLGLSGAVIFLVL